jgi:hypothetical protein
LYPLTKSTTTSTDFDIAKAPGGRKYSELTGIIDPSATYKIVMQLTVEAAADMSIGISFRDIMSGSYP